MSTGSSQQSPAYALIPFTGYYSLDAQAGSFLMVDTHEECTISPAGGSLTCEYFGKITLSPDGKTSEVFPLGTGCTFDGNTLLINVGETLAKLTFSNTSGTSSVSGTINDNPAAGSTPFGPVQLSLWTGTYYLQQAAVQHGGLLEYPYTATLQVNPDGTMLFAADHINLTPVPKYWYDYGMFVIGLMLDPNAPEIPHTIYIS